MLRVAFTALALLAGTAGVAAQDVSPESLQRRAVERRATEAVIWGMPAVNYDLMLQEMLTKTTGKINQVIYWGRPLDWHNQTLTPNPDTIYFMAFFNTKDAGPIVIDVPPRTTAAPSMPTSSTCGRCRSKMRGCWGWTRGRASSS